MLPAAIAIRILKLFYTQFNETPDEQRMSITRGVVAFALFLGGAACIGLGILPFINNEAGLPDFADLGFIVLILFFMGAYFKATKTSRFLFWAACFSLIIYTNLMFLFYGTLFA